jgi:hypothetical protein
MSPAVPALKMASEPESADAFNCHFTKLSRELRNLIYEESREGTLILNLEYGNVTIQFRLPDDAPDMKSDIRGWFTWLLACKLFIEEGLEEVRRSFTWGFRTFRLTSLEELLHYFPIRPL